MPAKKEKPANSFKLPSGTGRAGEAAAEYVLRSQGHDLVRKNYRVREGEIDLITSHDGQTVFVEVKTRRTKSFGSPEESISPAKARRLVAAAQSYLAETGDENVDWRIDLLAIEMDNAGRVLRSNLIKNAITE